MAGVTARIEGPVEAGGAQLRVLVRQGAEGRALGRGLWFAARKEPVAVVVEIGGARRVIALTALTPAERELLSSRDRPGREAT